MVLVPGYMAEEDAQKLIHELSIVSNHSTVHSLKPRVREERDGLGLQNETAKTENLPLCVFTFLICKVISIG